MLGLTGYGSSGESSGDEDDGCVRGVLVERPAKTAPERKKVADTLEDAFYGNEDGDDLGGGSAFNLPSSSAVGVGVARPEGALEEIVKPKDWELKLAEKARRKQEKKAAKKEKKREKRDKDGEKQEKKEKPKRAQISAFGALAPLPDSDDEDDKPSMPAAPRPTGTGLLSMLPQPKKSGATTGVGGLGGVGSKTSLVPPSLRNKQPTQAPKRHVDSAPEVWAKRALVAAGSDSDSDGEGVTDFFGFSSASAPLAVSAAAAHSVPAVGEEGLGDEAGPARPTASDVVHPSQQYNMAGEEGEEGPGPSGSDPANARKLKTINDKQAHDLIFKYEMAPWGFSERSMSGIVENIVDVNVDDAIGPDVNATLLRNLNHKAMAKASMAPIPKTADVKDRNAKQKHQITYLAQMAVSREESLQEQWAAQKHTMRASKQKYGF